VRPVRRPRNVAPLACTLTCVLTLLALAACGTPEYTCVTHSADRTYVKIPASWKPVENEQLDAALGLDPAVQAADVGIWHVAYDAAPVQATDHLVGWSATDPVALVSVRQIPPAERGSLSLDGLRDLFFPVSPAARAQAAAGGLDDFALLADEVLTPGSGLRGVHTVYRYRLGSQSQMIDQTVYLNDDASTVYLFFVRCSTTCYQDRREEIENAVSSFTVRGKP
jgi:hypothetical protein